METPNLTQCRFGLKHLRSVLANGNDSLNEEEAAYLAQINASKRFLFESPTLSLPTVFFVQTGGSEIFFKECYESFPEPYVLLVQGKRNSLAASLEIKTFLSERKKRCILILGTPEECAKKLEDYHRYFMAEQTLRNSRLGVIGTPSDWLIGSPYDKEGIRFRFGVEIIEIPMEEFLEEVAKKEIKKPELIDVFKKKTSREEDLKESLYIYSALKNICVKYKLSGFTLRCFDLLQSRHQTSCLAFGLLNDEGIVATCEGDVPTMLSMALIQALTGKPSFMANPSEFDLAKNEAIFAHCTCPFSMIGEYTLHTHFESGLGFGIRGKFPLGKMTVVKLKPDLSALRALPCVVLDNLDRDDLCRSQIRVRFDGSLGELLNNPYGNHLAFASGDVAKQCLGFFDYLKA